MSFGLNSKENNIYTQNYIPFNTTYNKQEKTAQMPTDGEMDKIWYTQTYTNPQALHKMKFCLLQMHGWSLQK